MDRENMFGLPVIRKAISMKVNGLMVTEVDMGNSIIYLDSPYLGATQFSGIPLYYQEKKDRFQYIVTFESSLGDLSALQGEGSALFENGFSGLLYFHHLVIFIIAFLFYIITRIIVKFTKLLHVEGR